MEGNVGKGLSPKRIVKILAKHGTQVNLEQATLIQGFMEKLVSIVVRDLIKQNNPLTLNGSYRKLG